MLSKNRNTWINDAIKQKESIQKKGALFGKASVYSSTDGIIDIEVDKIEINPLNKKIQDYGLGSQKDQEDFDKSLEQDGILQPLLVYQDGEVFRLISGHRRFRYAQKNNIDIVKVNVIDKPKSEYDELRLLIDLNLQARHYSRSEITILMGIKYPELLSKRNRGVVPKPAESAGLQDNSKARKTYKAIAQEEGISERKIRQIAETHKKAEKTAKVKGRTEPIKEDFDEIIQKENKQKTEQVKKKTIPVAKKINTKNLTKKEINELYKPYLDTVDQLLNQAKKQFQGNLYDDLVERIVKKIK